MTLLGLLQLGSSIICLLLAVSLVSTRAMNPLCARILGANFALSSAQLFLAFLVFDWGLAWLVYLRVVLALLIGPLLLAYFVSVLSPSRWRKARIGFELLPLLIMITLLILGQWQIIDGVIILSFLGYTLAAMRHLRKHSAAGLLLPSGRQQAWRWLYLLLVMMVVNLLTELGIAFEVRSGIPVHDSTSLLVGNAVFFAFSVLVLMSTLTRSPMTEWMHELQLKPVKKYDLSPDESKELVDRWRQLMVNRELFMADRGVTITRAAKILGVPSRHLSQAINSTYGASYSQYMNDYRVERAKHLLLEGEKQSITNVFLAAGFSTKSHFHREFSRVVGMTPSEFRVQRTS